MKKYSHDVIIIGGGSGGLTATAGFSQLGLKTLIIEKERLGGDCLFYGCVPSKTLITSARVMHLARQSPKYGLPVFDTPNADASAVMGHVNDVIKSLIPHDSPERFRGLGAEVIFGSPRFISPHEIILNEKTYSAASIILSVGSEPFIPPIPGLASADYLTNKTIFSLEKFPSSLVTIGGGPIGSELSQALSRFGVKVSLLEASSHILAKDDPDAVAFVEDAFRSEGIDVHINTRAERIEPQGEGYRVFIGDGKFIDAESILVATGRRASLESLDLEKAGVELERGFIRTDSHLSTSQKHILAIGDCNGKYLFTHTAGAEGGLAIRKIAFHLPVTMDYSQIPWCTYTDPEIASVGLNEKAAKASGVNYSIVETPFVENDRALAEADTSGKMKALLDKKGRLIGMQIIGAHAGELLGPALYAYRKKLSMSKILGPIFPYPTRGESYRKAAGNYLSPKLFNNRVRAMLRFLFGYRGKRE